MKQDLNSMQPVLPYMAIVAKDEVNLLKDHITYAPMYIFHRFINEKWRTRAFQWYAAFCKAKRKEMIVWDIYKQKFQGIH